MIRLAYFVSHPIQYQAPLLRRIAAEPDIQLKVFFYSDFSLKAYQDPGFGQLIKWDIPLTKGYDYEVLDTWGSQQRKSFLQQPVGKNVFERLKHGQFDAVWVHGWSDICSLQAIIAAEKLCIPVLMRGDSNVLRESKQPVKKLLKKLWLGYFFKKITAFTYIGKYNYQFYQKYGVGEEKLFFTPYAVDNDYFQKEAKFALKIREEFRQSLNLESGRPIILYAGKLQLEIKRIQDLLAAYQLLSSDGLQEPDPYLLLVGSGEGQQYLEAKAKEIGWQSIRFMGFRHQGELPAFYDLCDVFVLPSAYEAWGLVVNEVMNAGKAVVVSDQVGCAPDLILEGQNGCTFPVGDIKACADAIRWALNHTSLAGEASLRRIQTWSFSENLSGLKASLASIRT
jgi:glycosyltransferase involved in cell wall biosynthesis